VPTFLKGANAGGAWYPVLTRTLPTNPPVGQMRMYAKTGATSLFYRDSSGTEYELRPAVTGFDISTSALWAMTESYATRVLIAQNFR